MIAGEDVENVNETRILIRITNFLSLHKFYPRHNKFPFFFWEEGLFLRVKIVFSSGRHFFGRGRS
jgi:hypothetical protein